MIVAIDIGNTQTVIGFFKNTQLINSWRLDTSTNYEIEKIWQYFNMFCEQSQILPSKIHGIVISSVVPDANEIFCAMFEKNLNKKPLIVSAENAPKIKINYDKPSTLGADRICNAIAVYEKYGGPAIVIDFGTATTFDVISKNGDYLGGVITIGIDTAAWGLHHRTAKLPKIELHFPEKIICTNTTSSIQAGIMYGTVDMMEGILKRIFEVLGVRSTVVSTGGYAPLILNKTAMIDYYEPNLVLEGARIFYERVCKSKYK